MVAVAALVVVTSRTERPEDRAARAAAPTPTLLTAEVLTERVVDTIVVRAVLVPETVRAFPPPSPLEGRPIVTRPGPTAGTLVREGDVVAVVAERPLLLVAAPTPFYRDLRPSMTGPDVTQLQEALIRIGLRSRPSTGVFDAATASQVRGLYERAGFRAASELTVNVDGTPGPAQVVVPAGELAAMPAAESVIDQGSPAVGETAEDPIVTLASTTLRAAVTVPGRSTLEVGASGVGRLSDGTEVALELTSGAEAGDDGQLVAYATLTEAAPSLRPGAEMPVTFARTLTEDPVLLVPVTALREDPDGTTFLEVVDGAARRRVRIDVGATGDGLVQVEPTAGALTEGMKVVLSG